MANKITQGKQLTGNMNVDYLKSSHVKASVIDDFIQFVDYKYGDPEIGEVKSTRGKIPH